MRSLAVAAIAVLVLSLTTTRAQAQVPDAAAPDVDCAPLAFTACLLNLGCIYDAIEGSCKAYGTVEAAAEDTLAAPTTYEFSYEDFLTTGIEASPPMLDVED